MGSHWTSKTDKNGDLHIELVVTHRSLIEMHADRVELLTRAAALIEEAYTSPATPTTMGEWKRLILREQREARATEKT
jgi:hypothetical protein